MPIIAATKRRWAAPRKAKASGKSGAPEKATPAAAKPGLKRAARTSAAKKSTPAVAPRKTGWGSAPVQVAGPFRTSTTIRSALTCEDHRAHSAYVTFGWAGEGGPPIDSSRVNLLRPVVSGSTR